MNCISTYPWSVSLFLVSISLYLHVDEVIVFIQLLVLYDFFWDSGQFNFHILVVFKGYFQVNLLKSAHMYSVVLVLRMEFQSSLLEIKLRAFVVH